MEPNIRAKNIVTYADILLSKQGIFLILSGDFFRRGGRRRRKAETGWEAFGFTISFGMESFEISCHLGFKPQE